MATTYQCPVCIWQSHQGKFTARLLDDFEEGVAVGDSRKEVLDLLREYVGHRARSDEFFWLEPDFSEATVRQVKVTIVPEYRDGERRFPCREPIHFRLPCAVGRRESGLFAACFPTLDVYFDFYEPSQFNELAVHYARQFLGDRTPRELSRFLPPVRCEVETLSVTVKEGGPGARGPEVTAPALSQLAEAVGKRTAGRIGRAWERDGEVQELARILKEEGGNVCLVGETGCGKSTILVEAVRRLGREPDGSGGTPRFWLTSAARIVAGMRYLGEWQLRCEEAIRELAGLRGVLCVENLLDLLGTGGTGPESSLASFLIPYLRAGELRLVGEATPLELEACDRVLPGLVDELRVLKIEEFSEAKARSVLALAGDHFSQHEGVIVPRAVTDETYHLFRRFQPYVSFPGRAIQLLGAVADRRAEAGGGTVDPNEIREEFAARTGLPAMFLRDDLPLPFDVLRDELGRKLLGQPPAVDQVCRVIAKFKAGLNDPGRPVAVMLFVGPTGVGKTQMVKLLGDTLFPGKPEKERLVRLDMSEYAGPDAAERLLGNVYGKASELVGRVRANPFSVILFDEVEKASPEVFDLLMNVFDEGRLCDALGRATAFNSAILVMTSNLGASRSGPLGFRGGEEDGEASPRRTDTAAVRAFFRPEFFNRIDHVVEFLPLGRSTIEAITRLELEGLSLREGFSDRKLRLAFTEAVVRRVADAGFDPVYGARPLQRCVEEQVVLPLARLLVEADAPRGKEILVDWDPAGDRVVLRERTG